jgi:ABC-2 type transport system permease protein
VGRKAFQRSATYKLATFTGCVVNSFFGYIHSYVFVAVYSTVLVSKVAGFSLEQALSYVWFSQAMITVCQIWFDKELSKTIVTGDAISDFSKPFNYQLFWLSKFVGNSCYAIIFRAIPTYTIGVIFFGARLPQHFATFVLFVVSLALSVIISFLIGYLFNLTTFWTLNPTGVLSLGASVQMFFSGFIVPLAYLPDWLLWLANILPFQAIISIPMQVWLAQTPSWEILLPQVLWLGLLWLAGAWVTKQAFQEITIQGG